MLTYHEIPRTHWKRRHTKPHWLDAGEQFQQEKPQTKWVAYMCDKIRDEANPEHVVTFANQTMRDKWLAQQYPNAAEKRRLAREAFQAVNRRAL